MMPKKPNPPTETWMDAQQYALLSETDKKAVSTAVETYENEVAAAKKKMADTVAEITEGKLPLQ
jgi:hypothetical protein